MGSRETCAGADRTRVVAMQLKQPQPPQAWHASQPHATHLRSSATSTGPFGEFSLDEFSFLSNPSVGSIH